MTKNLHMTPLLLGSLTTCFAIFAGSSCAAPANVGSPAKPEAPFQVQRVLPSYLKATYNDKGLQELRYRDDVVIAGDAGRFEVKSVRFLKADGTNYAGDVAKPQLVFDAVKHKVRLTYAWGAATCAYEIKGDALHITTSIENGTQDTIDEAQLGVLYVALPGVRVLKSSVDNENFLGASATNYDNGVMALENWEAARPVDVMFAQWGVNAYGTPLTLGFTTRAPQHEVVDAKYFAHAGRPIPPGKTDSYHVALRFAGPGTPVTELSKDAFANFREAHPQVLKWPDRRPIATIFLANSWQKWEKNPRGYMFGKASQNDITTPEGLKAFGEGLMAYADQCIPFMKAQNVQGVIVWDIEGQQYWHPLSYVGHPNMLPKVAPEMDGFADAFFKKFRDAGFKVGVCIRPTEIYETGKDLPKYDHRDVKDPVALMSSKIAYAKKRWDCKYFYLDSNTFSSQIKQPDRVPWVLPAPMLAEVTKQHPDILLIPEWVLDSGFAYTAGYSSDLAGGTGTSPIARAIYPDAFSTTVGDWYSIDAKWDTYVNNVLHGDVMITQAWWNADMNGRVKGVYQEVGYLRAGPPPALRKLPLAQLALHNQDADARTRYFVAKQLGETKDPQAVPALLPLLDDADTIVQKNAVVALGNISNLNDSAAIDKLMRLMAGSLPKDKEMLRIFASDTLGKIGEPAVSGLAALVRDGKQQVPVRLNAIKALGISKTTSPEAIEALLPVVAGTDNFLREAAVVSLGQMHAKQAIDALIDILAAPHDRNMEGLYGKAVKALIEIGDPKAIEPLIQQYRGGYSTVVVYWIYDTLDQGLRKLTGQNLVGLREWEAWLAKSKGAA